MSSNRLFTLKPELKISVAEASIIEDAYEKMKGKRAQVGHIVQEIAQEALDKAITRYTMMLDRG